MRPRQEQHKSSFSFYSFVEWILMSINDNKIAQLSENASLLACCLERARVGEQHRHGLLISHPREKYTRQKRKQQNSLCIKAKYKFRIRCTRRQKSDCCLWSSVNRLKSSYFHSHPASIAWRRHFRNYYHRKHPIKLYIISTEIAWLAIIKVYIEPSQKLWAFGIGVIFSRIPNSHL